MESNKHKELEREMAKKLKSFEATPPDNLWDKIAGELDKIEQKAAPQNPTETSKIVHMPSLKEAQALQPQRSGAGLKIWWVAASALFVLGAGLYIWNLQNTAPTLDLVSVSTGIQALPTSPKELTKQPDTSSRTRLENSDRDESSSQPLERATARNFQELANTSTEVEVPSPKVNSSEGGVVIVGAETLDLAENKPILTPVGQVALENEILHVESTKFTTTNEQLVADAQVNVPPSNDSDFEAADLNIGKPANGVSRLLNMVVAKIDRRAERKFAFTTDEDGSLRISFNQPRNRH